MLILNNRIPASEKVWGTKGTKFPRAVLKELTDAVEVRVGNTDRLLDVLWTPIKCSKDILAGKRYTA